MTIIPDDVDPVYVDPRLIAPQKGLGGFFSDSGRRITQGELGTLPVVVALIGVWTYFWFENHRFISASNLTNLMLQLAPGGTIAIGVVLVLLIGEIDLAITSTGAFAAAAMVVLNLRHGWPAALAIIAGLVTGAIVGLIQGLFVTRVRVPAFILTLAGQLILIGLLLRVLGPTGSIYVTNQTIINLGQTFYSNLVSWIIAIVMGVAYSVFVLRDRARRRAAGLVMPPLRNLVFRFIVVLGGLFVATLTFTLDRGLPLMVLIFICFVIIIDLVLRRTPWGRHVFATGGNIEAARRAGIGVQQVRLSIFILSSTLAAAGAILLVAYTTSINTGSGQGTALLYAVGAAVIGGTSLFGGRGSAWSAFLGSLVIYSVDNGMALLSKPSDVRYIVTGSVLIAAVTIDALARRGRASAGRA